MAGISRYFESGAYVADTTRQTRLFGPRRPHAMPSLGFCAISAT